MAHFQSFVCYKRSFDMRIVTCCREKTLCDSVKYKNSPVGSLMWTWWCLLFCMLLSVTIGRSVCMCVRETRERQERDYTCRVCAFVSVYALYYCLSLAPLSCLYSTVPTSCDSLFHLFDIILYYSLHFCCHANVSVCVCVCLYLPLYISPANWFVFPVH